MLQVFDRFKKNGACFKQSKFILLLHKGYHSSVTQRLFDFLKNLLDLKESSHYQTFK